MIFRKRHKKLFWAAITLTLLGGLVRAFSRPIAEGQGPVIISEFVASNATGLIDEDGNTSDWIELYNRGSAAVNLAGWSLSDDPQQPGKWAFPALTLGSGEYLVIFASGKNRVGDELHTNFRLQRSGEFLGLFNVLENRWMDSASPVFPDHVRDLAYGRFGAEAQSGYLSRPTPGGPNDDTSAWDGVVAPIEFSVERGFYEAPFNLRLSTATAGATILYTTDGSEPADLNGTVYTRPIRLETTTALRAVAVKPGFLPSSLKTHTYIFLESVLAQPPTPAGFPGTWGTYPDGSPLVADYEMDPDVVTDPRYRDLLRTGLKTIPTLSIVTDVQNLDIYANTLERGQAWERAVSVELIQPGNSRPDFQINAGLRIQGGVGRSAIIPKHSFRLFFKGEYGPTKLAYPLFPDSPVESFDTVVLRAGMNRSYAGKLRELRLDLHKATYSRDQWLRASQIAMSGVGSHGIFVHLYLNGLYWGLYNVVERPDASFMASYFGGRNEDWFAINHSGPVSGAGQRFARLHQLARAGGLAAPEKYDEIQQYLDLPHFIDYIILNFFSGNEDWGLTNWYAGVRNPDGQARYFSWDGELTWIEGGWLYSSPPEGPVIAVEVLFKALLENPDFRLTFADRMYRHLFNGGALTDQNSQERWRQINANIEAAMVAESARWGDVRYDSPITYDDWLVARDEVMAQMEGNVARWVALAREAGYYPPHDPPAFSRHGGQVSAGFELTMSAGPGTSYYTTDGSDPRTEVSGAVAPQAMIYRAPLVLTSTTTVKARTLVGKTWSALHEARFQVVVADRRLRITEIMYNPTGGGDFEFIELTNTGERDVDLSNLRFEGIDFTFPPRAASLTPGQTLVLVRNAAAFNRRYPGVKIGGVYDGQLSNRGETIVLVDASGQVVTSVAYDDENGWPVSPDGRGDSLVLIDPAGDPNDPRNWRASTDRNGSPGADDPGL